MTLACVHLRLQTAPGLLMSLAATLTVTCLMRLAPVVAAPVELPGDVPGPFNTHFDIQANYSAGAWELLWENHDVPGQTYEPLSVDPNGAYYALGASSVGTRPASSAFNFVGVAAGDTYYRISGNTSLGGQLFGVGAEETNLADVSATWSPLASTDTRLATNGGAIAPGSWVRLDLVDFNGPGEFSSWSGDESTITTLWIATAAGGNPNSNSYVLPVGDHFDPVIAFTAPGVYELTFQATTQLPGGSIVVSDPVVFTFTVVSPIPEPSTYALMGVGLAGLWGVWRSRRGRVGAVVA